MALESLIFRHPGASQGMQLRKTLTASAEGEKPAALETERYL